MKKIKNAIIEKIANVIRNNEEDFYITFARSFKLSFKISFTIGIIVGLIYIILK